MPVTIRMAFRNLFEHKAKSLIVGILLALGVLILVVGNSFLDASKRGVETSFTRNYTGDVIITGVADGPVSLFGVQSMGGMESTPIIPDYEKVLAHASGLPGVRAATAMASGYGIAMNEGEDPFASLEAGEDEEDLDQKELMATVMMLFGVDSSSYWRMFDSVKLVEGAYLEPGKPGVMLSAETLPLMAKRLKRELKIGDEILVQGFMGASMRLRSVPIVGTFAPVSEGTSPEQLAYVDIDTLRVLSGMTVGTTEDIDLGEAETGMLATDDLDSLFGGDMFAEAPAAEGAALTEAAIDSMLGDTSERERLNQADTGAWHSILLRLDNPARAEATVAALNAWFASEGIQASAGDWKKAAGPYAQSVDVLRIVFTVAIVILAIVAIIIIMNTLVVSIIERTGEIGTMRALGGGRSFVRRLFATETVTLSVVFGLIGMLVSFLVIGVIGALKIEASNEFFQILFGGKVLAPVIQPLSLVAALALIMGVGLVASIYPVSVALRVQPVKAMQSE